MAATTDRWLSPCGRMELRQGPWEEVLADVVTCDAVICDPPYSERTHKGALSATGEHGVNGYSFWSPLGAQEFAKVWSGRCNGWVVIHTDDQLHPSFRAGFEQRGCYAFPPVPVLQQMPRVSGDGPGSHGHYLAVSRPREKRFLSWGSLPGWYECGRDGSIMRGGKPLDLMRAIVRDYTRPGDLIVDPCAGGGTTLLAAAIEGRRAIGAELDPKTFAKAIARLSGGYTPELTLDAPKQTQSKLLWEVKT